MSDSNDLEPIKPLIEFYAREMGPLAGRLMAALSLLTDLEDAHGWDEQGEQARQTVRYSRLLVAAVLREVAAAQVVEEDPYGMAVAIRRRLGG